MYVYVKTIDLCFEYGLKAVTKVLAKSVFGYCVTLFIFLIYLVQKCISWFLRKHSDFSITLKSRSVQAFLMAILFSLQKIVIEAFSLVQWIEILETKVLYIQGDVKCYTWWQNVIQVYICVNVLPLLFIISHAPFYVQDRKMSVQMFILTCVIPLPAFLYFITSRLIKEQKTKRKEKMTNLELSTISSEQSYALLSDDLIIERDSSPSNSVSVDACGGPEGVAIPFIDEDSSLTSRVTMRHRGRGLDPECTSSDSVGHKETAELFVRETVMQSNHGCLLQDIGI